MCLVCESNIEVLIRVVNVLDDRSESMFGCQRLKGTFQPIVTPSQYCQYIGTSGAEKRIWRVKIFLRRFKWMLLRAVHLLDNRNRIFAFFRNMVCPTRVKRLFFL